MNTEELKRLALAATPGPWFVVGQPWNPEANFIVAGSNDPHMGQYVADTEDFDGEGKNVQENAAYIAAANPAAILSLIAERDELLEALKGYVTAIANAGGGDKDMFIAAIREADNKARAAITKAESK